MLRHRPRIVPAVMCVYLRLCHCCGGFIHIEFHNVNLNSTKTHNIIDTYFLPDIIKRSRLHVYKVLLPNRNA